MLVWGSTRTGSGAGHAGRRRSYLANEFVIQAMLVWRTWVEKNSATNTVQQHYIAGAFFFENARGELPHHFGSSVTPDEVHIRDVRLHLQEKKDHQESATFTLYGISLVVFSVERGIQTMLQLRF